MRRAGRFGDFIGCENYPKCKYTRPITLGIKCPKCNEGEFVRRGTSKGRGARADFLRLQPLSGLRFHNSARTDCRALPEVRRAVHCREADEARQFPGLHPRKLRLGSGCARAATIRPSARASRRGACGRRRPIKILNFDREVPGGKALFELEMCFPPAKAGGLHLDPPLKQSALVWLTSKRDSSTACPGASRAKAKSRDTPLGMTMVRRAVLLFAGCGSTPGQAWSADGGSKLPHSTGIAPSCEANEGQVAQLNAGRKASGLPGRRRRERLSYIFRARCQCERRLENELVTPVKSDTDSATFYQLSNQMS